MSTSLTARELEGLTTTLDRQLAGIRQHESLLLTESQVARVDGGSDGRAHPLLATGDAAPELLALLELGGALGGRVTLAVGLDHAVHAIDDGKEAGHGPHDQAVPVVELVVRQRSSFPREVLPEGVPADKKHYTIFYKKTQVRYTGAI